MLKFRLKEREVEAIQYTGHNWGELQEILYDINYFLEPNYIYSNDWLVIHNNTFYAIIDDREFRDTYELVQNRDPSLYIGDIRFDKIILHDDKYFIGVLPSNYKIGVFILSPNCHGSKCEYTVSLTLSSFDTETSSYILSYENIITLHKYEQLDSLVQSFIKIYDKHGWDLLDGQ